MCVERIRSLEEAARALAYAELGHDRVVSQGHTPEDYINGMDNYTFMEFLSRALENLK